MHAYPGEVMTEARFRHGARCRIEWLSRRANDFMHDRWWKRRLTHTRGVPLQHHRFVSAPVACAAARVLAARALALQKARGNCSNRDLGWTGWRDALATHR